jgi:hypothetical protein
VTRRYPRTYHRPRATDPHASLARLLKAIEPREHSHEPLSQDAPLRSSDALHRFRRRVLMGVSVAVVVALACIFIALLLHRG